ncbi:MAG TPA: hypothetical protein VKU00_33840 [Chthonomonadaceae bacterium]|nr:hypothetical protein [Chthonomonadaceae bacterium]
MLRRISLLLCLLTLSYAAPSLGQADKPQSAQALLDAAMKTAKTSHKTIWVTFDASW